MGEPATVVLDVGKTMTKINLWSAEGRLIEHRERLNERVETGLYVGLDAGGIEWFVGESLEHFGKLADVEAIIPVGHGAAAVILGESGLVLPPLDYEHPIPLGIRR